MKAHEEGSLAKLHWNNEDGIAFCLEWAVWLLGCKIRGSRGEEVAAWCEAEFRCWFVF